MKRVTRILLTSALVIVVLSFDRADCGLSPSIILSGGSIGFRGVAGG